MRAILQQDNWWLVKEQRVEPEAFPINIGGKQYTVAQLELINANALSVIIFLILTILLLFILTW